MKFMAIFAGFPPYSFNCQILASIFNFSSKFFQGDFWTLGHASLMPDWNEAATNIKGKIL